MSKEINWDELPIIKKEIGEELQKYTNNNELPILLDVGGIGKYWKKMPKLIEDWKKILLNFEIEHIDEGICGDICKAPLKDNSVDVVFSRNTFEHIKEPWIAAEECVRIVKPEGLIIHRAPFSWRYHAKPVDYYRYSHEGLAYLFERTGKVNRIVAGYSYGRLRQRNRSINKVKGNISYWSENWISIYIGRKTK